MSTNRPEESPPPLKRRRVELNIPSSRVQPPLSSRRVARDGKPPLRIFSWNVNGIAPFLPPDTPSITKYFLGSSSTANKERLDKAARPCLRECLRRWQWPDLIGLQEVKIAPTDEKTQVAVRRSVNAPLETETNDGTRGPLYDAHFCLPRDKYNATGFAGKVYGVCALVRKDTVDAKIKTVEWDLEGRVSTCEIPNLQIVVINVYAVNGTDNDYRDPATGKFIGTRHDRKRDFHTLLANEVQRYESSGWNVLVAGDINVSRTKADSFPQLRMGKAHVRNRADFERKFITELGMLDTFRFIHANKRKYTYRPVNKPWGEGGDRVDMILATKGLEDRIRQADILDTEEERGPSDHVPHFVELKLSI